MEPGNPAPRNVPTTGGSPAGDPDQRTAAGPTSTESGLSRLIPRPRRGHQPVPPATEPPRQTLEVIFTGPNSLGAIRLLFAWIVLLLHGLALSGHHTPALGRHEYDAVALDGFFAISGLLVTRSATRLTIRRFLRHRALRILPGFWVCLLVVAFVLAPMGWWHVHGSLRDYPITGAHGALRYVTDNALVRMRFYDIAGTPQGTFFPAPGTGMPLAWDGSLWSLWWEVQCYVGITLLAVVGLLRRRPVLAIGAIALGLSIIEAFGPPGTLPARFSADMARFTLNFLAGTLMCLYAERIPLSGRIATIAGAVFVGSFYLQDQPLISALPLAYLCVYLGVRLPLRRLGARHDLSYGLYIYGFPIQQLAAVYGLHHAGLIAYLPVTVAATVACATASWFAVEAPALRRKSPRPRRPDAADRSRRGLHRRGRQRAAPAVPEPAPVANAARAATEGP
ncbi:acyltransferase [Frankia sp. AgB32]|uniref:acyltransferase family protein n=1 Tax=Frankia sp. AgB32 TaxID=631119 RepID=UPI00200FA851|nr:acyltransferase [Frankia sp. AgB32]MCK9896581.1 acyltransferase [Frankia sp. AgB32]